MIALAQSRPSFEPTARIRQIREQILGPKSVCLERPALLREYFRSHEQRHQRKDHPILRRARALAHVAGQRTPHIFDGELVIGNMTSKRVAANVYPEGGTVNILEDLHRLESRPNPFVLSTAERLRLAYFCLRALPSSVPGKTLLRPSRIHHFVDFFRARRFVITEEAGIGHQLPGYGDVVRFGLNAVDSRARKRLEQNRLDDGTALTPENIAFFQSVRVAIAGIRKMAHNLAAEALRLAHLPDTTEQRRRELIESARACRRVPYEPATTMLEGLQACWLVHVGLNLEDFEQGMSFGRLDQILWPLYQADLAAGRLTPESTTELLASFQLKTCETLPLYSERIDQYFAGNGVAQAITLGGTDAAGRDVTNELSGLFLDAYAQIRTREPALHVRVHGQTPQWFLSRAAEVVQLGCGKPAFFGDDALVSALQAAGFSQAHARDYGIIGCVETASQGRTYNSSDAALFNLPLCLELALNQGRQLGSRSSAAPEGARTPPPDEMLRFDDLVDAFRRQVEHTVAAMVEVITWLEHTYREIRPTPLLSTVTQGPLDKGRDVTWGGGLYDLTSIQCAGLADVADSLLAVRELVYEKKRMTLPQLVQVLEQNFEGHKKLHAELGHRSAKYGNGDAEADAMAQLAADVFAKTIRSHKNSRGGRYVPGFYSMTCHIGFGKLTSALPNGRKKGHRFANGLSPSDGADQSGPTAILRSAASLDSTLWANCYALNLKFDAASVQGAGGAAALAALVRSYVESGGMQVQINVLDDTVLRQAKEHPEAFPGIVVRVAGYCAYFADLTSDVQDEIIERTAHGST